ncbi:DUF6282 family protein [Chloroflexota bacterium]
MSVIDKLLQGAIDMHIHSGPDGGVARRLDALQIALQAQEAGMRAVVLKSHEYPTAPVAYLANQIVPDFTIIGSIVLNLEIGGLNARAVKTSAKLGARVVWMPTFSAAKDVKEHGWSGEGVSLIDGEGKLLPEVDEILGIIKDYRMVLATGHISAPEIFALVDRAKEKGLSKIIITHPLLENLGAHLSLEDQRRMVEKGAFIEHCFVITMPLTGRLDPMKLVEAVRVVGAEHCILSTDFGQDYNAMPAEGMRMLIATMLQCGLSEREIELTVKVNPAKLLDLD